MVCSLNLKHSSTLSPGHIERETKRRKISRAKFASRMKTKRATLDHLFAQSESSVTLQLLEQAALALDRKLKIELA
jgi:hypothetical protein